MRHRARMGVILRLSSCNQRFGLVCIVMDDLRKPRDHPPLDEAIQKPYATPKQPWTRRDYVGSMIRLTIMVSVAVYLDPSFDDATWFNCFSLTGLDDDSHIYCRATILPQCFFLLMLRRMKRRA